MSEPRNINGLKPWATLPVGTIAHVFNTVPRVAQAFRPLALGKATVSEPRNINGLNHWATCIAMAGLSRGTPRAAIVSCRSTP